MIISICINRWIRQRHRFSYLEHKICHPWHSDLKELEESFHRQSSGQECDTYEYDRTRTARWFVVQHPPDSDGPDFRDAQGRSLRETKPQFAEFDAKVDSPDRTYMIDMVTKADARQSRNDKLAKLRALRAQHSSRRSGRSTN